MLGVNGPPGSRYLRRLGRGGAPRPSSSPVVPAAVVGRGILFLSPEGERRRELAGAISHRPRQLPAPPSPPGQADPSPDVWRRIPDATSVDAPAKGIISAEMTAGRHACLRFESVRTDDGVWPSPVRRSDAGERSILIRLQMVFLPASSVSWILAKPVIFVSARQRPNPIVSPWVHASELPASLLYLPTLQMPLDNPILEISQRNSTRYFSACNEGKLSPRKKMAVFRRNSVAE